MCLDKLCKIACIKRVNKVMFDIMVGQMVSLYKANHLTALCQQSQTQPQTAENTGQYKQVLGENTAYVERKPKEEDGKDLNLSHKRTHHLWIWHHTATRSR